MAGVLDALASYIQNMMMEMAKEEVHMLLGVSSEIDNMGIKLRDLKNFLADADRRNITDQSVQAFVRELRDAMYDATDILDLCQLKAMERSPRHDAGCLNPLLFCIRNPLHAHNIGSRIKNLNKKLDGIKARSESFNFINLGTYKDRGRKKVSSSLGIHETSWGLDDTSLVGEMIEEDTKNLVELLTKKDRTHRLHNKITVFAIVGVGGIGKTTLARKIFKNDIAQQEFSKKIWLSVNQDFNELDILRRVITEAGGDYRVAGETKATLERILTQALIGHNTLIIMDDVWDYRAWEDVLRTPLVNVGAAENGSRILVTTRNNAVARGMMAEEPYYRLRKLEPQDAWLLLKKQVVVNINDEPQVEMLKEIGMEIIAKCDGLPLAVKVIGGLLRQKTTRQGEWEKVLNDSIWSISQMPAELNNAIYLSYEDLHPNLKQCFLYYCILPRSTVLFTNDIIGLWISEGFVHGNSCDLEEKGREYLDELIQRNLIEPGVKYVDEVCNMHDIVRSFAQYVIRDEALVCHNNDIYISDKLKSEKFFRLSIQKEGSKTHGFEWCSLQTQTSLRTLISVGHIKIKPGDSLLSFSSLRTLYMDSVNFDELGESLYQLKHLRYLSIKNSEICVLPENIGKLKFLQYISLSRCKSLVKLPSSIGMLKYLRQLDIRGTSITTVPKGFCGSTCLTTLYGFPAHMNGDRCTLEELGPLSQLMNVNIIFLENVASASFATPARLGEKNHLRLLALSCKSRHQNDELLVHVEGGISEEEQRRIEKVFDELCPPPSLEIMDIKGYFGQRLPRWMMPASAVTPLRSLRILSMDDLVCCTELPSGWSQLPCLENLLIRKAPVIKRIGLEWLRPHNQEGVIFPRLQRLNIVKMVELEEWLWEEHVKGMPMLEEFILKMCKLRHFPAGLAIHAKALKTLCIYDVKHLSSLENFAAVVRLDVFRNTDLERITNLPKLQKLVIVKCPKMKALEAMPALQSLDLEDYSMETVPRYLQDVNPRHLLLDCSLSLLTSIAAGKSGLEWHKLSHIQQVKAYANDVGSLRKWYVVYTRDPFRLETNISFTAIAQARRQRRRFRCIEICPAEDEWPVERGTSVQKRLPLCLRFRWLAYARLCPWLRGACLHCREAARVAAPSDQWTEAGGRACTRRRINGLTALQQQNGTRRA